MWTIIEKITGKVLFSKSDDNVLEGQVAIYEICTLEIPEGKELYFNFETEKFYLQ